MDVTKKNLLKFKLILEWEKDYNESEAGIGPY